MAGLCHASERMHLGRHLHRHPCAKVAARKRPCWGGRGLHALKDPLHTQIQPQIRARWANAPSSCREQGFCPLTSITQAHTCPSFSASIRQEVPQPPSSFPVPVRLHVTDACLPPVPMETPAPGKTSSAPAVHGLPRVQGSQAAAAAGAGAGAAQPPCSTLKAFPGSDQSCTTNKPAWGRARRRPPTPWPRRLSSQRRAAASHRAESQRFPCDGLCRPVLLAHTYTHTLQWVRVSNPDAHARGRPRRQPLLRARGAQNLPGSTQGTRAKGIILLAGHAARCGASSATPRQLAPRCGLSDAGRHEPAWEQLIPASTGSRPLASPEINPAASLAAPERPGRD